MGTFFCGIIDVFLSKIGQKLTLNVTLFSYGPVYEDIIFFSNVTHYHSIRMSLTGFYRSERQPGINRSDLLWGRSDLSLKTNNLSVYKCLKMNKSLYLLNCHT